jgi:mannose-6-phosphate isomerase-like protein (cupin superfamily)
MNPLHTQYNAAETFEFSGAITLKLLLSGSDTNGTISVFEDIVQPGVGPGRHIHHGQDETFMFLEGSFDVEVGGTVRHMSVGDVAFVPRETVHAFKNTGASVGRIRYIFSPALKMEAMFRAFYKAEKSTGINEVLMKSIAAEHGQTFVGPPL